MHENSHLDDPQVYIFQKSKLVPFAHFADPQADGFTAQTAADSLSLYSLIPVPLPGSPAARGPRRAIFARWVVGGDLLAGTAAPCLFTLCGRGRLPWLRRRRRPGLRGHQPCWRRC